MQTAEGITSGVFRNETERQVWLDRVAEIAEEDGMPIFDGPQLEQVTRHVKLAHDVEILQGDELVAFMDQQDVTIPEAVLPAEGLQRRVANSLRTFKFISDAMWERQRESEIRRGKDPSEIIFMSEATLKRYIFNEFFPNDPTFMKRSELPKVRFCMRLM